MRSTAIKSVSWNWRSTNNDKFVKGPKARRFVIPVETGIQGFYVSSIMRLLISLAWIPACAGMTTFYETIYKIDEGNRYV
jgi:hypothetical protein